MRNLLWAAILFLLTLTACNSSNTASRQNDFTTLTSMRIIAPATIAFKTSAKLTVIGNFSGMFERDITDQVVWTTSDPAVASFSFPSIPSRIKGVAPGTATLTASQGAVKASTSLTVTSATITPPLTITPLNPSTPKGLTTQFAASGTFSDGSSQDLTFDASWLSSAPAIATVSDAPATKGLAQAVTVGSSTVSATFDGVSGSTTMTVLAAALKTISITPANPSVLSMSSAAFKASGTYSDGSTADITGTVSWTSSQNGVATIGAGGAATTLAQGSSLISATLSGVNGFTTLKVTGGNLTGFTLSPSSTTLVNGTVGRITATGTFSNGTTRDITGKLTWTSNSPSVTATAPGGNLLWINAAGVTPTGTPARVTASISTLSAFSSVTVTAPTLNTGGLQVTPASRDISIGTSTRFTVTGTFSDTSRQDLTYSANWVSSSALIAEALNLGIDKGRVRGVNASSLAANISAEYGLQTATVPVTVSARTLLNISTSGFPVLLTPGTEKKLTVTATYTDGTSQDVTEDASYSIDNTNVLIMADSQNQPGTILIVDSGTAKLTVGFGGLSQASTFTIP